METPHPELRLCRVLDEDPDLVSDLDSRQAASARRRATAQVISLLSHPSVELRLVMLFCHLAERWGEVERDGAIRLPLALTHDILAGFIGQTRPYVTGALSRPSEEGLISRRDGDWFLSEALSSYPLLVQDDVRNLR